MAEGGRALATAKSSYDQEMENLGRRLQASLGANWSGAAQTAYVEAKQKWDRQMDDLQLILTQLSSGVVQTGQDFADADKASEKSFLI